MTTPMEESRPAHDAPAARSLSRFLRPAVALPVVIGLMALAALLAPEETDGRGGDGRLTTQSASPLGARLLYELAGRLGFRTERWTTDHRLPIDSATIVAVLAPPDEPSAIETHRLLDGVRRGGALFYVMTRNSALSDSLEVRIPLITGGVYVPTPAGTAESPDVPAPMTSDSVLADSTQADSAADDVSEQSLDGDEECAGHAHNGGGVPLWTGGQMILANLEWRKRAPHDAVIFAGMAGVDSTRARSLPVAVGFALGRGRVVAVADPDLVRNDVLRVCRWGADIVAIRMLEYLSGGGGVARRRLVFDEYSQGYGAHPGTTDAILEYLVRTPSGHLLLQALGAGLVLLLAFGPRAVAPRDVERFERRSPFEHVTALANAYGNVGATRTVAMRLLRGVRRRVERPVRGVAAASGDAGDDAFLDRAEHGDPRLAPDVALVRRALRQPMGRGDLEAAGEALGRIEQSLLSLRGSL